jgi:hypothetical protein
MLCSNVLEPYLIWKALLARSLKKTAARSAEADGPEGAPPNASVILQFIFEFGVKAPQPVESSIETEPNRTILVDVPFRVTPDTSHPGTRNARTNLSHRH